MMNPANPWSEEPLASHIPQPAPLAGKDEMPADPAGAAVNRRHFLAGAASVALLSAIDHPKAFAVVAGDVSVNLAKVATASASHTSGDTRLSALNDGFDPLNSGDDSHGSYGNWPHTDVQWVQYEW